MAERAAVEAQRPSSRHPLKPAPQADGPPPTGPEQRQGPPAASPPPYQPSTSAHDQQMPRYRRHREFQPNPEAETVRAYPRVHIRPRPRSPHIPTAEDYEDSPRPANATSLQDPIIPTHANSSAQGHGPAQGPWPWGRPAPLRALLLAGFARFGGGAESAGGGGGGASCLGVGRPALGALPRPTARHWGVRSGPATHWLLVRGGWAWGPVTYPTARSPACRLCALLRRHEGAPGGHLLPGCGMSEVGRSRSPDRPSLGRAAGVRYQLAVDAGGVGVGTRYRPHSARSCEPPLRAVGAARGRPGGGASCVVVGGPGLGALLRPTACPWGVRTGPANHRLWVRCAGVGARLFWAPSPGLRFVVCCACFPCLRHPLAVIAWHLSLCLGCGRRRVSLACLVATRCCAAPRSVRSLSVHWLGFPSPWCLPPRRGLLPPALLGGCAGHTKACREPGSLCLPLAPAEAGALGSLRLVPVRGPAMGLSLPGPSSFCLGLRALRWYGVCRHSH